MIRSGTQNEHQLNNRLNSKKEGWLHEVEIEAVEYANFEVEIVADGKIGWVKLSNTEAVSRCQIRWASIQQPQS